MVDAPLVFLVPRRDVPVDCVDSDQRRQKVEPATKPSFMPLSQKEMERMETRSARQRRLAIQDARRRGEFDDRAERERRQERIRILVRAHRTVTGQELKGRGNGWFKTCVLVHRVPHQSWPTAICPISLVQLRTLVLVQKDVSITVKQDGPCQGSSSSSHMLSTTARWFARAHTEAHFGANAGSGEEGGGVGGGPAQNHAS